MEATQSSRKQNERVASALGATPRASREPGVHWSSSAPSSPRCPAPCCSLLLEWLTRRHVRNFRVLVPSRSCSRSRRRFTIPGALLR
jgi:hypothetical protein